MFYSDRTLPMSLPYSKYLLWSILDKSTEKSDELNTKFEQNRLTAEGHREPIPTIEFFSHRTILLHLHMSIFRFFAEISNTLLSNEQNKLFKHRSGRSDLEQLINFVPRYKPVSMDHIRLKVSS